MNGEALDIIVKGDVVLPDALIQGLQVGVRNGVIAGIYQEHESIPAREVVDASGCLVFPGIVDAHVHTYSNAEEGMARATAAAAAGGVTTFIEMPFDAFKPVTNPETLQKKIAVVEREGIADTAIFGTLAKGSTLDVVDPMIAMGVCGFKVSVIESDPKRFPRIDDAVLYDLLPMVAKQGLPVSFHAENGEIISALTKRFMDQEKTYPRAHCESRPVVSETIEVLKILELAHATKAAIHIHHVSHPRSIHLVRWFRDQGVDVTTETCPHYLILCEDDMDRLKAFGKINPPLRTGEASRELWDLLFAGDIDMLASDHAPWPLHKKQNDNIFMNSPGSPSVETILPLIYYEGVVKRKCSPVFLARVLAENPARRFKLFPRKGHIAIGADADFAILNPRERWTIRAQDMRSSAGWTPYEGMEVQGKVVHTIRRGETIFQLPAGVITSASAGAFIKALK